MIEEMKCIYCDNPYSAIELTTEHIIPEGLGGETTLNRASCLKCNVEINKFETRIMRGHWLTYRRYIKTGSKHGIHKPKRVKVKITTSGMHEKLGTIDVDECPVQLTYYLYEPEIFGGIVEGGVKPYARSAVTLKVRTMPSFVQMDDGTKYLVLKRDKVEFPVDFDSHDLFRLLAKIAHAYAIKKLGVDCCRQFYLRNIILGDVSDAMLYIGNASELVQNAVLSKDNKFHTLRILKKDQYVTVLIQLFNVSQRDPQPVYQVVVGEMM